MPSPARRAKELAAPRKTLRKIRTVKLASEDRHIGCDNLGLASLSLASGCTDVLSFLKLGNLFTSAMTGNSALLAVAIGGGQLLRPCAR
jgi:hypothetical protein